MPSSPIFSLISFLNSLLDCLCTPMLMSPGYRVSKNVIYSKVKADHRQLLLTCTFATAFIIQMQLMEGRKEH